MINSLVDKTIKVFYDKKSSTHLEKIFRNVLLIYFLICFFFWNVDFKFFEAKYLTSFIPILCLFIFPKKLIYLKDNRLKLIILFLFFHFIFVSFPFDNFFINGNLLFYSYFVISILSMVFLYDFLKQNFYKLILYFKLTFNSFFIIFSAIYFYENGSLNVDCYRGIFSETNFIFKENSHFGLISSAVLLYSTNALLENQVNKYKNIFVLNTIIFIIISFLSISTSFLLTVLFVSMILLVKNRLMKKRIFYTALIFLCLIFLNFKEQCNYRSLENFKQIVKAFDLKKLKNHENDEEYNYDIKAPEKALSYKVFVNSLKIGVMTLPQNLTGVGINNYFQLFEKYNETKISKESELNFLNVEDASNNFSKIIGEFGIFGIFFYLFILFRVIKINTSNSFQLFLITSIIAQSLRGVGYFSAAFILITTVFILNIYDEKFKKE